MEDRGIRTPSRHGRRRGFGRGRRGSDRGVALVEFALVIPVLFLVLFGIIEFGMGLNDYQSIRHGVREGTRQAVVQHYGSTPTDCTTITAPDDVKKVICLTKDRIGLGNDVRVQVEYTAPPADDGSGGSIDYGSVNVCAQRAVKPLTGAIPGLDTIHLKSSIEMRMERAIADSIEPTKVYAETPPSGGDWTGC